MSSTEIKFLKHPEGIIEEVIFSNSHGSAPVVWDIMAQHYLGLPPFHYNLHTDKLWPLWKKQSIPLHQRAVLGMTYDNTVIVKEDFARAAADIKKFLEDFPVNTQYENHWPGIQAVFESDPDCDAIGFHWTTVNQDPFQGLWDEDNEEYGPPVWGNFWSMYLKFDRINDNNKKGE